MRDVSLRIKNLSISLEALSRINCEGSQRLYNAVETLLTEEIDQANEENHPVRPAYTDRVKPNVTDDDISF